MNGLLIVLTALSLATAAATSVIAWRAVRENRRRSDARVALLAEAIRADEPAESPAVALSHLLDSPEPSRRRQRLVVAAGVAVVVLAVLVVGRVAGSGRETVAAAKEPVVSPAESAVPGSLDLTALTHELGPDGRLELRGQVRIGAVGANMEPVTVVVLLFDRQGAYLSSSRAPLQTASTETGGAATFLVTIPDGDRVGRYRVSFRAGDRIVPHVDRRQVP